MSYDTRFVYTLSSRGRMVQDGIRSVRSLLQFADPEQITVFYTPPATDEDVETFRSLGLDVRREQPETEPFSLMTSAYGQRQNQRHYGEKVKVGKVDAENVVFLDCDTFVARDPALCLDGDFDFKARPDPLGTNERWSRVFDKHGESELDWLPHSGVMAFKNGTHREIYEDWREYMTHELEFTKAGKYPKDETALALAVSGYDLEKMPKKEHVIERRNEHLAGGVVYHHGARKIVARVY